MISPEEIQLALESPLFRGETVGLRVLLAEDDPALQRYLEVVLRRAGYVVLCASDGLAAMKILLTVGADFIVTDAVMPNLNGYELCRFARSNERLASLPIVLLTALDAQNAEAELADQFLSKPVSPEQLLECMAELLKAED